jgi:AcrR family transcriptional regulator
MPSDKSRTPGRFERHEAEVRRKSLVEATIECLKRHGHEGLSVRRISAEAGVSIGLINHHFPNKNALVAEAYRHFNSQLIGGIRAAVERAPDAPREKLRALFKATFSPPNLDRDVLTVWIVLWGLYHHSSEIQAVHEEAYGGYMALLREQLAGLQKQNGRLRLNLRLAAIGLQALLDGLWLEWCLDPDNFSPREAVTLCETWVDNLQGT